MRMLRPRKARPAAKMSLLRRRPVSWTAWYSSGVRVGSGDVRVARVEGKVGLEFEEGDSSRRRFWCGWCCDCDCDCICDCACARIESAGGGNLKFEKRDENHDIVRSGRGIGRTSGGEERAV